EQYQQNEIWKLDALNILACGSYSTGEQEQGDSYTRLYKRLLDQQADTLAATDQIATMRGIFLAREDWSHATHEYTQLVQNSEPFPKPTTLSTLTELIVMTGEQPENQPELCERASKLAKESGARHAYAIARRASGRMNLDRQNWEQAELDLKEALAESESLDLVWDQGQAHYCLGLLYRRRAEMLFKDQTTERTAEISRARFQFEQAIGFFESLKAVRDAQRVRRAIAQDSKAPV
ncbi:MAG TPA: hypothetical protein VFN23_01125, partial [Ktedonobacteraceae bacterium]|nr:hypothetical protein [Ktedonobacteraceae bacterium]